MTLGDDSGPRGAGRAPFDRTRYENDVVKPLRRHPDALPDDLAVRYAIEADLSEHDLRRRLREVRAYWRLKGAMTGGIGLVCRALLRADEELVARHGDAFETVVWWQERRAAGPVAPATGAGMPESEPNVPESGLAVARVPSDEPGPAAPGPEADADARGFVAEPSAEAPAAAGLEPSRPTTDQVVEPPTTTREGEVPPPTRLRVRRRGTRALLSWVWPEGARLAEIRWHDGRTRLERLPRSRYRDDGGFMLSPDARGLVEVRVVVGSGDRRSVSTPAVLSLDPPRDRLHYVVRTEGSRRQGDERWALSLADEHEKDTVEVEVVVIPGRTIPTGRHPGSAPRTETLIAGGQVTIPFPALPRPFWIRCFSVEPDKVLIDPPPEDLKVT